MSSLKETDYAPHYTGNLESFPDNFIFSPNFTVTYFYATRKVQQVRPSRLRNVT